MIREECYELIDQTALNLGIASWITKEYKAELFAEADGHPYVIKILLGEMKKAGKRTKVERILAGKDQILDALFERTYSRLTPAARRTFLMLSNWGAAAPELAVEAVLLQTRNERFDVAAAMDELVFSSFVTRHPGQGAVLGFIEIPLAAAIFGRSKLSVEPMKVEVDEDIALLRILAGPAGEVDNDFVEKLFRSVARQIANDSLRFQNIQPILEFVSTKIPSGWLLLSQMYEELGNDPELSNAKGAVRRYLEVTPRSTEQIASWERLAALCQRTDDYGGWIDAQASLCELPGVGLKRMSNAAALVLTAVRKQRYQMQPLGVKRKVKHTIPRILSMMAASTEVGTALDFSQAAWLSLLIDDHEGARTWTNRGLALDPENVHCISLAQRLGVVPAPKVRR